jgi:hypothetical protein
MESKTFCPLPWTQAASTPFDYRVINNFMPDNLFDRYYNNYPVDYIKQYCSNPEVSEHSASLYGNYSAPMDDEETPYDPELLTYVQDQLLSDIIKSELGSVAPYDHFFVNCHYDMPGSSLEVHNDLKDFRWLITNQIYLDHSDQGVRLLNRDGSPSVKLDCEPNMFYSMPATPYSWHDVPELHTAKRSILFRVGKRKWRTIAAPKQDETAYIIYNNYHCDSHYAKLGLRMGNLTEAWFEEKGVGNIYHTKWRDPVHLNKLVDYATKRHSRVRVVLSGYFPSVNPEIIKDNAAMQTVTNDFKGLAVSVEEPCYHQVTENNIRLVARAVFGDRAAYPEIYEAEQVLWEYTQSKRYLKYKDQV